MRFDYLFNKMMSMIRLLFSLILLTLGFACYGQNLDTLFLKEKNLLFMDDDGVEYFCTPYVSDSAQKVVFIELTLDSTRLYYMTLLNTQDSSLISGYYNIITSEVSHTDCWIRQLNWKKTDASGVVLWEIYYENGFAVKPKKFVVELQ